MHCGVALRATEAFAAVQALVARAIAHGDVAADGAGGCVLLEVRDGVVQGFHGAMGAFAMGAVAVAFGAD